MNNAVNNPSTETPACICKSPCACRSAPVRTVEATIVLALMVWWFMGIVIAKGFWGTTSAIVCPPWSWYLVVERAMTLLLGPLWL